MAIEPPSPSAEQLAEWRALVERVRQGDRSQVVAWDEVAAAGTIASYRVLVTQRVHRRLRGAQPLLVGSVAGIIAVLRVDPTEASMISPASPWRCWVDGDLRRRSWVADLLGPGAGADRGAARPDLGGMTDHTGRRAQAWVVRDDREVIGTAKRRLVATRHAWVWLCVWPNG
jgi:hypothetical protein